MGLTHSSDSLEEALIYAIKEKNVTKVRTILKKGAKVNYKDAMGFTPLMHSAVSGVEEITVMLLHAGSDVTDINYRGLNALALAKFNGCTSVYNILIEAKSNPCIIDGFRLSNMELMDECKYNYLNIIRREVYCEDDRAKDLISDILDIIEAYKDDRVELILLCIALYTLETDWTGNNLQIFVTSNIDVSVFKGNKISTGYLLGTYNIDKNIIQTSNFGGKFIAAQTLLHEMVHKVHLACCHLKLARLDSAYNEAKKRLEQSAQSVGKDYIQRNMVIRVSNIPNYSESSLKTLEYLADPIAYTLICNKRKDETDFAYPIQYILEPIYNVFDKYIATQLMEYVIHNKNFNKLVLSDAMKTKFSEYKDRRRKDNIQFIPKEDVLGAASCSKNIYGSSGKQLK